MADTKISDFTVETTPPAASDYYVAAAEDTANTAVPASMITLAHSAVSADSNQTMVAGTLYLVTMGAWASDNDFTLPVAASVSTGDRCGIYIVDGDADYELDIKTGAAGDLLKGTDHSSTAWSRLFIPGELVIFQCIDGSTGDWMVEHDGRIAINCWIYDDSNTTWSSGVITQPNFNNTQSDNANVADLTNDAIKVRRPGSWVWAFSALSDADFSSTEAIPGLFGMYNSAATAIYSTRPSGCNSVTRVAFELSGQITVALSDTHLYPKIRQDEGNTNFAAAATGVVFQIKEILT